jgi:hypothetical protein
MKQEISEELTNKFYCLTGLAYYYREIEGNEASINNSIQFVFICVLTQQPKGQLQNKHV